MGAANQPQIRNPKELAEAGERIYREKYQSEFETKYMGKFVALDVRTEQAHLGETSAEALEKARASSPLGLFHLIRVGSAAAFQVGSTNGGLDWLL